MMISTQQLPSTIGQRTWPRLGGAIYGLAAMSLGAVGLAFGDFAGVWQPVPPGMPGHTMLAYIVAVCFLVAGAAIQRRRFARSAVIVLGAFYLTFALLWLPRIIRHPHIYGTWGDFFEQSSFVPAALALYGDLDKSGARSGLAETARVLFGICVVSFALNHFFAIPETATMIPNWIPPGQQFWAITTGVAHLLAALTLESLGRACGTATHPHADAVRSVGVAADAGQPARRTLSLRGQRRHFRSSFVGMGYGRLISCQALARNQTATIKAKAS